MWLEWIPGADWIKTGAFNEAEILTCGGVHSVLRLVVCASTCTQTSSSLKCSAEKDESALLVVCCVLCAVLFFGLAETTGTKYHDQGHLHPRAHF